MKTNSKPDAIPPTKYPSAFNVRTSSRNSIHTRPGYISQFNTANNSVTDIKAYATIGTDDLPRFLARTDDSKVYLDNGNAVATLAGNAGYGASMIAFRPGASSQSWMYVASIGDYQKLSAPDANNNVTAQKVGIAEPQAQLEAATNAPTFASFFATAGNWTQGGTAAAPSNSNLIADTVGAAVIADPVVATRLSVQVSIPYYTPGMLATFAGANTYPVEEIWQACAACTVSAIRYDSGTSGACSIVPSVDLSDTIGRGSLIRLNASETVLVLSVTKGTNGTCFFRCSTAGTIAAAQAITGLMAIVVHGTVVAGDAITLPMVTSLITTGTGTLSKGITAGTFSPYQQDDYIHVTMLIQDISTATTISFVFNVATSVDYVTSILTYSITGAALASRVLAGEVIEVHFPISALSPVPGALNPCNGFRVEVVTTAAQSIAVGGLWVGGGGSPDVGDAGASYMLRAAPRSSLTGARGNATPPMRYGVIPRRQSVTVSVPSASYDTQIDIWDYYATGGAITAYGYVGSVEAGASSFTFNYFDDAIAGAIAAGNTLPTQNFEPWPSIDVSWSVLGGGGNTITAVGSTITVSGPASWPASILKWLPGTLVTLAGFQTYTLRARPVALSGTSYLFEIEEALGSQAPASISVAEPIVANQHLPYVWGPDAYGVIFGNGDPLRPGTQYFSRAYAPDIAPQTNTLELSTPDKPLVGGCIRGGVSICASTSQWWALYPNAAGGYSQVDLPVGHASVSPYTIDTDGSAIYFWARDGICRTGGAGFDSLTNEDLYNLFPHDGVPGSNVVVPGGIAYAPDYARLATFRLAIVNGYLYADYQDSRGIPNTLVCDLRGGGFAWSVDRYVNFVTCHYQPEQSPGAITGTPMANPLLLMGDSAGHVWKQQDLHNDHDNGIIAILATFEWDGGDARAPSQWGDAYLDLLPATHETNPGSGNAGVAVNPLSGGNAIADATYIPFSANRQYVPVSLGGEYEGKFLGLQISWVDDYANQNDATQLYLWQPSRTPKPEVIRDRFGDWSGSLAG